MKSMNFKNSHKNKGKAETEMWKRTRPKLKNNLSYTKAPTPYTRRASPEFPSTTGVGVSMTKNGYRSLWQGKDSPVTQNIEFPPHYA